MILTKGLIGFGVNHPSVTGFSAIHTNPFFLIRPKGDTSNRDIQVLFYSGLTGIIPAPVAMCKSTMNLRLVGGFGCKIFDEMAFIIQVDGVCLLKRQRPVIKSLLNLVQYLGDIGDELLPFYRFFIPNALIASRHKNRIVVDIPGSDLYP